MDAKRLPTGPRSAPPAHALCASYHHDDGLDPRTDELADRREVRGKPDRKTDQLCKQARIALDHALRLRTGEPLLQDVAIDRVEPAPNASRLRVTLVARAGRRAPDEQALLDRLVAIRGSLRAELAAAITRKRVPELVFSFAPVASDAVLGSEAPDA